jgi:hypothetical protein
VSHPTQEKVRVLCLILLAAGVLACREEEPTPSAPTTSESVPFWALCENWVRRDGSCDPASLLADYEECLQTEGLPTKQRMVERKVRRTRVSRTWQRTVIVCLEKRHWMLTEAGVENLPGRPRPGNL